MALPGPAVQFRCDVLKDPWSMERQISALREVLP